MLLELHDKGFTHIPKKTKKVKVVVARVADDIGESEESLEGTKGVRASDFEYLSSMTIGTLTLEKVQEPCANWDKLNK